MQTFLPFDDFKLSAACLDNKRLNKQRIETKQILLTLLERRKAWSNHPAVRMWEGYEKCLARYGIIICKTWRNRGFKDSLLPFFEEVYEHRLAQVVFRYPIWLGRTDFHMAHRSNLLRKSPEHYSKFFICVPDNLPYVWPA